MPEPKPFCASVALAAYAEAAIEAGRVLVVGEATSPLIERLLERGARLVHVVDPEPTRVAEAATRNTERNVSFAPLGGGGLPIRDGAFDVAIVENLAAAPEPAALLRQLRRALGARGTALIACPNPEASTRLLPSLAAVSAPDYYALHDLVSAEFEQVRMLGQTPFVGYAVVDFAAEGEPEPTLDADFVPGGAEEPEWFVAVAAPAGLALEAFSVVQLPAVDVLAAGSAGPLEQQVRAARAGERQARDRLAELEAERARSVAEARTSAREVDVAREADVARLQTEIARREQWARQLEERATTADARADAVQAELDAAEERLTVARRELGSLASQLEVERQRAKDAARALEAERLRVKDVAASLEAERRRVKDTTRALEAERQRAKEVVAEREVALERAKQGAASAAATRELEALRSQVELMSRRAAAAEGEAAEGRRKLRDGERELAAALERAAAAERQRDAVKAEKESAVARLGAVSVPERDVAADLIALERQLVERGQEIRALQRAARESARAGAELLVEVEAARSSQGTTELAGRVAELERQNATLTADLEAANWTMESLRVELGAERPAADPSEIGAALQAAEARLREQAVLIEQLRAAGAASSTPPTEH